MKRYLLAGLWVICLGVNSTVYAIDSQVVLVDSTANSGFSIKDASDNTIARFMGDGKVGIGTTTPISNLDINGAHPTNQPQLQIRDGLTTARTRIWAGDRTQIEFWKNGSNESPDTAILIGMWSPSGGASDDLLFHTYVNPTFSERMRISSSSGNVGIGTTVPTEKLHVVGNIYASGSITQGSSRELKEHITSISTKEAMETLNGLNPIKFKYKADDSKEEQLGFIAEDVPELVATKDHKRLNAMDLTAVLVKVVQEQQRMIQKQQEAIEKMAVETKMVK
jgi:hypothetical protein